MKLLHIKSKTCTLAESRDPLPPNNTHAHLQVGIVPGREIGTTLWHHVSWSPSLYSAHLTGQAPGSRFQSILRSCSNLGQRCSMLLNSFTIALRLGDGKILVRIPTCSLSDDRRSIVGCGWLVQCHCRLHGPAAKLFHSVDDVTHFVLLSLAAQSELKGQTRLHHSWVASPISSSSCLCTWMCMVWSCSAM